MLHSLAVTSVEDMLQTLQKQVSKQIQISDFFKTIPDGIEEQEVMLQVKEGLCN